VYSCAGTVITCTNVVTGGSDSSVNLLKGLGESKIPEVFILVAIVCVSAGSNTFHIKRERRSGTGSTKRE
jgi:hypothetical protein